MTGRRTPSRPAPGNVTTAVPLLGVATALLGLVLLVALLGGPRLRVATAGSPVTVSNLRLSIEEAAWVEHDMASMGPMPMPGMPAPGSDRIHVKVLLDNGGRSQLAYAVKDFRLVAGSAKSWAPLRSTMPAGTVLPAGASMAADLYFEVPDDETQFSLTLQHDREQAIVPLALPGATTHLHAESPDR